MKPLKSNVFHRLQLRKLSLVKPMIKTEGRLLMKKIALLVLVLALVVSSVSALATGNPCPNGHTWRPATCTSPKTCVRCGATSGTALGHNWNPATCTKPKTCSRCGATTGGPNGHSWGSWTLVQTPTATTPGKLKRTCSSCGASQYSHTK